MTAFNSIKTNNWPSASNDLEDFLVLELPLNDQAALTSSRRDIVAGSTVLHPKRTLTNTAVSMVAATGSNKKHYDKNAILVSGNSNYLQTVDMASVSDSDYTYECYALADGTPSSWSLFHTNPTSRKGILALFTSATNIQLYFGNGGNWSSNHNFTVSVDNAWHHYAVVRQNGGDVSLYMDGVLKGTHTPGAHTHGDLVIGRQSGDNNLYWNGLVQDFRVYRTAKYTANFTPPGAILV